MKKNPKVLQIKTIKNLSSRAERKILSFTNKSFVKSQKNHKKNGRLDIIRLDFSNININLLIKLLL